MLRGRCGAALALLFLVAACGGGDGGADGRDVTANPGADVTVDPGAGDTAFDWGGKDQAAPDVAPDAPAPDVVDAVEPTPDATPEVEPDPEPVIDTAEPLPEVTPDVAPIDTTPSVTPVGTLAVNCAVPYVLDASQATSMMYMAMHFGDLVQSWCITGTVGGLDVTQVAPGQEYPEKMFYGSHPAAGQGSYVSLMQASMNDALAPVYSVRVDFDPDTAVKAGSVWGLGLGAGDAFAMLLHHTSQTEYCVQAVGVGGSLTFSAASNVTAVEGGSFTVAGSMDMGDPHDLPGLCDEGLLPCCP